MEIENLASDAEDFTGNVWKVEAGECCALVDTGKGDCWERIRKLDRIDTVVLTHTHPDHVGNLEKVVERFSPEVYAYEPGNIPVGARELEEGDTIDICGTMFEVIHTPGHKNDSICIHSREEKVLFTGDLVFPAGEFGRTDLEEGDRDRLINSIEKVAGLEVDSFYPGHGDAVTEEAGRSIRESLEEARKREPKY